LSSWNSLLKNDFEESVFQKYPSIKKIKNDLYEAGAVYASMSGSGAAVFGIFNKAIDIKNTFPTSEIWVGFL
jgi:4-diphosphocytidyl-2-C-methyl-D-erythritol kinase